MTQNSLSPDDIRLMMRQAFMAVSQTNAAVARRLGIHITDLAAVEFLNMAEGPTTPTALAHHLQLTTGAATAVLDRLQAAKYVKRRPNPEDRRGVLISLDGEAREKILAAHAEMRTAYGTVISAFSHEDLATVARFMQAIATVDLKV